MVMSYYWIILEFYPGYFLQLNRTMNNVIDIPSKVTKFRRIDFESL